MSKTIEAIKLFREVVKLVLLLTDCYIDTLETVRQIMCFSDVLLRSSNADGCR